MHLGLWEILTYLEWKYRVQSVFSHSECGESLTEFNLFSPTLNVVTYAGTLGDFDVS